MKTVLYVFLFLATALVVQAKDAPKEQKPPEWLKYTQPGPAQKNLDNLVGTFTYTMHMWTEPKAVPVMETGTSENKWVLGGRFVQQNLKGKSMGQDFEGIGYYGYDNFKGEYQSVWLESMSTGIMTTKGAGAPNAKLIREEGVGSNPYKNEKNRWYRAELKINSKNEHTYTMYTKDSIGKEYKTMEVIYKRQK